ncbi:hypothetical protein MCOR27_000146 [Pyricularia oryzae]|uniref:Uncharacterized protein n=2 Tax=Pyricularia TaxID=48558 RepID=A0ABQ8N8F3_PYRGI|nr:hypothetical protein MCOR01_006553 [Pyricularia oryzae]KAI6292959.1 hypothetical protein MCOR33_009469 [Pyricularia grisea]KAH9435906.1 hypothetical protein MCOR02_004817 [Pyricularia oryzae]KAI6254178.1 hypothetical protein MCOR19_009303 [Pyricularia oryzae]KAI6264750.1 hypothetical protein MCOR26_011151 [Pyricularia oryzae]
MSTPHLSPSSSRVSSRNSSRSRANGASTAVNGSSYRVSPSPAPPPASERIANPGSYRVPAQSADLSRLVASDPLARELEGM